MLDKNSWSYQFYKKIKSTQKDLGIIFVSTFFINILGLALPMVVLQTYDRILPKKGEGSLHMLFIALIFCLLCEIVLRLLRSYLISWTASVYEHTESCRAINHVANIEIDEFKSVGGESFIRKFGEINKIRSFLSGQAIMTVVDIPFVFFYLVLVYYISGLSLLLSVVGYLCVIGIVTTYLGESIQRNVDSKDHNDENLQLATMGIFRNIIPIKSNAFENFAISKHYHLQKERNEVNFKFGSMQSLADNIGNFFAQYLTVILVTLGALSVIDGHIGVGTLAAVSILGGRLMQPVQRVLSLWSKYRSFMTYFEKFSKIYELEHIVHDDKEEILSEGKLVLENVSFEKGGEKIFENVYLEFDSTDVVSLYSENPAHTKHFINLVLGLEVPDKGAVLVDGHNTCRVTNSFIGKHVAYISSYNIIFRGTIWENLSSFNDSDPTLVRELCRDIGLDKIISSLPSGQDTFLNNTLADPVSGGVKNIICLVRALARKPGIVIFNETGISVDFQTYNQMFKILGRYCNEILLIIVSSDMNMLSLCETHLEIQNGQILERKLGRREGVKIAS